MSGIREWMINTLSEIDFLEEEVPWWTKTTKDIYHSYTKNNLI